MLNKISWSQKTTYYTISFSENIQNSQICRQKSRIVVAKNSRDIGMEIAYGNGASFGDDKNVQKLGYDSWLHNPISIWEKNWTVYFKWVNCTVCELYLKMCSVAQSCPILCDPYGLQPTRILSPWDSPGTNTRVGCHFLLQEIFPTQGLNLCLLRLLLWQADFLLLSHLGSPYLNNAVLCFFFFFFNKR